MTHRALELMAIPPDQTLFLMDIGCGSGLSGEILEELGHIWVGLDIAPSMLGPLPPIIPTSQLLTKRAGTEVALERQVEGDLFLQDIGQGMGFRPGSFDGAIRFVPPPKPSSPTLVPPVTTNVGRPQHIGPPMALYFTYLITTGQSPSTPNSVLHGPLRLPAQPFAGSIPVLPRNGRPSPTHNLHRAPSGFRWRNRG